MEKIQVLNVGERAIIVAIHGSIEFQNYLLANGISLGTLITSNYSPRFSNLINFSISGKMMSLRRSDFASIELVKI